MRDKRKTNEASTPAEEDEAAAASTAAASAASKWGMSENVRRS